MFMAIKIMGNLKGTISFFGTIIGYHSEIVDEHNSMLFFDNDLMQCPGSENAAPGRNLRGIEWQKYYNLR